MKFGNWETNSTFSKTVHVITMTVPTEISGSPALTFIPWLFHSYSLLVIKTNQYQETAIGSHSYTTIIHLSTISLSPSGQHVLRGHLPIHSLSLWEQSSRPSRSGTLQYHLIIHHLSSLVGCQIKRILLYPLISF